MTNPVTNDADPVTAQLLLGGEEAQRFGQCLVLLPQGSSRRRWSRWCARGDPAGGGGAGGRASDGSASRGSFAFCGGCTFSAQPRGDLCMPAITDVTHVAP